MTLSHYILVASAGVGLILMSFLGLIVSSLALAIALFAGGSLLTLIAAVGALWFSGPWHKAGGKERAVVIRLR